VVRLVLLAVLLICATAPAALAQEPSTDSRPATDSLATNSDTFVLVHGGFAGGWVWQDVAVRLRSAGQDVYTPTLTGLGERAHLAAPDVGLGTHVRDIVAVLEYENLEDVVLVGHSYGGFVVAGVVDRAPERIAHVVFLDALIPEDGEAVSDLYDPAVAETIQAQVEAGDGWRLPPLPPVTDPRFTPQPSRTFLEPLDLTDAEADGPARTYIDFTEEEENMHREPLALSLERAHERGWPVREVNAVHMGIWTHAEAVAEALLAVVGR
jgi:pimeloyl-ACP methyl ester carboxylesterase